MNEIKISYVVEVIFIAALLIGGGLTMIHLYNELPESSRGIVLPKLLQGI